MLEGKVVKDIEEIKSRRKMGAIFSIVSIIVGAIFGLLGIYSLEILFVGFAVTSAIEIRYWDMIRRTEYRGR